MLQLFLAACGGCMVSSQSDGVHLVVLLGEPGVGKTTLVQHVLSRLSTWQYFAYGLITGRNYTTDNNKVLIVLGSDDASRGTFAGTDAWSMRSSKDVPTFWSDYILPRRPCTILAEGCRVTYPSFIENAYARNFSISLVQLEVSHDALAERSLRASYNSFWVNGIRTRLKHLCQHYAPLLPYYLLRNNTPEQLGDNVVFLQRLLERGDNGRSG